MPASLDGRDVRTRRQSIRSFEKAQLGTGAGQMTSPFAQDFKTKNPSDPAELYDLPPGPPGY